MSGHILQAESEMALPFYFDQLITHPRGGKLDYITAIYMK
jgi:hypothetical protein